MASDLNRFEATSAKPNEEKKEPPQGGSKAPLGAASFSGESQIMAPVGGVAIMPITGGILTKASGSLSFILHGMRAEIVRAGINENNEQLGPLSMVMAAIKKAKDQADAILGGPPA
jgi:hypothetical protein